MLLGIFLIGFGIYSLVQSRVPVAKRNLYGGRRPWPWWKETRKPLGRYSCMGFGVSFIGGGILVLLGASRVLTFDSFYFIFAIFPLFAVGILGIALDTWWKKEPNQPTETTRGK